MRGSQARRPPYRRTKVRRIKAGGNAAQTHERGQKGIAGRHGAQYAAEEYLRSQHRSRVAAQSRRMDMAGKKKKTSWFIKKKLPVREVNAPGLKGVSARALARADRLGNRVYKVQRAAKAVDVILKIAGRIL